MADRRCRVVECGLRHREVNEYVGPGRQSGVQIICYRDSRFGKSRKRSRVNSHGGTVHSGGQFQLFVLKHQLDDLLAHSSACS
ncbi:hypothetical protein D3C72_1989200 [compost metagenome]